MKVGAVKMRSILASYVKANGLPFKLFILSDFLNCFNHYCRNIKSLN